MHHKRYSSTNGIRNAYLPGGLRRDFGKVVPAATRIKITYYVLGNQHRSADIQMAVVLRVCMSVPHNGWLTEVGQIGCTIHCKLFVNGLAISSELRGITIASMFSSLDLIKLW